MAVCTFGDGIWLAVGIVLTLMLLSSAGGLSFSEVRRGKTYAFVLVFNISAFLIAIVALPYLSTMGDCTAILVK